MSEIYNIINNVGKLYLKNKNIIKYLNENYKGKISKEKVIEIAYNFQSGSYIKLFEERKLSFKKLHDELALKMLDFFQEFDVKPKSLLDAGCGEMTTLTSVINRFPFDLNVFAFDTSIPRVLLGREFYNKNISVDSKLSSFVSSMSEIPLPSNSVDIVMTHHSIEPNNRYEKKIINELFRVTKKVLILFEPSFVRGNSDIQKRMLKHNYAKHIDKHIKNITGYVRTESINNSVNKLNPTYFHAVAKKNVKKKSGKIEFTSPGTDFKLNQKFSWFHSKEFNLIFPIYKNLPILKLNNVFHL